MFGQISSAIEAYCDKNVTMQTLRAGNNRDTITAEDLVRIY